MKHITLIVMCCLCMFQFKAKAQSGFSEGSYYSQQYSISDVPVGQTYYRYNNWGQVIGVFQAWKYAQWTGAQGGTYVYVWGPNGWQSVYYTGYYYWFNWVVYEKRVG